MQNQYISVLLIEDDPMVQEVNRQFIEQVKGFKIIGTAHDGKEGYEKTIALNPDLIILDIYMPTQNGIETLHQIRQERESVDVIVISAANDRETIRTIIQNGAIDYIIKPFKFERIQLALENYKSIRTKLSQNGTISQSELDEMLYSETKSTGVKTEAYLPKGLNEITLKQIVLYLMQQSDSKSAEEVAEGIGIARVTARRYLDYLEKNGNIELDIQYGGVGRPVNRYVMKNI